LNSGYVLSRSALQDICEIWDYLAKNASTLIADQVEEKIFEVFSTLVKFPHLGHYRPDLSTRNVLFFPVQSFMIVYEAAPEQVVIHAVLHSARDLNRILMSRPS